MKAHSPEDLLVRKRVASAQNWHLLNGQPQLALDSAPEKLINVSQKYNPHLACGTRESTKGCWA